MTEPATLNAAIQKSGLRLTVQRIAICKMIAGSTAHPSATMIYEELKEQYPTLSLATVYNTLDVLVGNGLINALGDIGDDRAHFDARTDPHMHLACVKCRQIVDIASEFTEKLDAEITQTSGYRLLGSRVLYYGVCPNCQQSE